MGKEAEFRGTFVLGHNEAENCKFYESNTFLNLVFLLTPVTWHIIYAK